MSIETIALAIAAVFVLYFILWADKALKMLSSMSSAVAMIALTQMPKELMTRIPSTKPFEKDNVEKG